MQHHPKARVSPNGAPTALGWRPVVGAVLLFAIALAPRLVRLSELSYFGDEDLTALAATAMLNGDPGTLPSGMEYRRAIGYTWVTALSLDVLGQRDEFAMRLPSALLGALTIPVFFLMLYRILGRGAAVTGALLLAFSEWHLVFSRMARMYAPTLLFMVIATWGLWEWVRWGRKSALIAGCLGALAAMSLHPLAVLCVAVPIAWLAFPSSVAVAPWAVLLVAGGLAAAEFGYDALWTIRPYEAFSVPPPAAAEAARSGIDVAPRAGALGLLIAAAGAALAMVWFWRAREALSRLETGRLRSVGLLIFALAAGALAGLGQIYGAALVGALIVLAAGVGLEPLWRGEARLPLVALAGLLGLRVLVNVATGGIETGLQWAASWPFAHAYALFQQEPFLCLVFGATVSVVAIRAAGTGDRPVAVFSILVLATLLGLGFARTGGPTRYTLPAYPWLVAVAGAGIFMAAERIALRMGRGRWKPSRIELASIVAAAMIATTGLLSGHGIPSAVHVVSLRHGQPVDELAHMFPFRPDHRSAGLFVLGARREGDVVIAEDPTVQTVYAGPVDYWFRRYGDMRRFLRRYPEGVRDMYAGSRPLTDPATIDSVLRAATGRVWLITSGETAPLRSYYLSVEQRQWLDSLERARPPSVTGDDGASAVYCLNCPVPGAAESDGREQPAVESNR